MNAKKNDMSSNYVYVGLLGYVYKMKRRDAIEMLEAYRRGDNKTPRGTYADLDIDDYGARGLSDRVGKQKEMYGDVAFYIEELYDGYEGADVWSIDYILKELGA